MNAVETYSNNSGYTPNPAGLGARNNFRHLNPPRQRSVETSAQSIEQQNDSINQASKFDKSALLPSNKLTVHPPMKSSAYKRHIKDPKDEKRTGSKEREITPLNQRKVPSQQQTPSIRAGKQGDEWDSIKIPSRDVSRGRHNGPGHEDQYQYTNQSKADNHSLHGSILVSSKETNSKNESAVHPDYFQSIYEGWNNSLVSGKEIEGLRDLKEKSGTIDSIYGTPSKILKSRDRTPKAHADSSISTLQYDSRRSRSSQRETSLLRRRGEQTSKMKNFTIRKISSDRDDQYRTVNMERNSSTDLSNAKSDSNYAAGKSPLLSNANSRNTSTRKQRNETTIAIFDSEYTYEKPKVTIPSTTDNITKLQVRNQSEERPPSQARKGRPTYSAANQLEPVQRNEKSLPRPEYRIKKDLTTNKQTIVNGKVSSYPEVNNDQQLDSRQSYAEALQTQESNQKLNETAQIVRTSDANQLNPMSSFTNGSSQNTESVEKVAVLPLAEKRVGFKRKKYFSNQRTSNPEPNNNQYPTYHSNLAQSEQTAHMKQSSEDVPLVQSPKIRREESNKNLLNDLSDERENPFEEAQETKLDLRVINTSTKVPFGDMMESSINSYLNEKDSISVSKRDIVAKSTNVRSTFKRSKPETSGYKRKSTAANSNDLSFFSASDHRESKINRAHLFESTENSHNNVDFDFNLEDEEKESKELLKIFKGKISEQLKEEKENEEDSIVNHGESESSPRVIKEETKSMSQDKSKGFLPPAFPFGDLPNYPFQGDGANGNEAEELIVHRHESRVGDSCDNPVMFESTNFDPQKNTIDISENFPRGMLKPSQQQREPMQITGLGDNSPKADHLSHVKPLNFYANGQKHTTNAPFKTNINPKLALQKELEEDG